jgi:hypothetical protein
MKDEITVYKNGCIARLKNRRICSKIDKDQSVRVELYNMVEKGKESVPVAYTEVNKGRSLLCFKLSKEGAQALVLSLIETLKIDNQSNH